MNSTHTPQEPTTDHVRQVLDLIRSSGLNRIDACFVVAVNNDLNPIALERNVRGES